MKKRILSMRLVSLFMAVVMAVSVLSIPVSAWYGLWEGYMRGAKSVRLNSTTELYLRRARWSIGSEETYKFTIDKIGVLRISFDTRSDDMLLVLYDPSGAHMRPQSYQMSVGVYCEDNNYGGNVTNHLQNRGAGVLEYRITKTGTYYLALWTLYPGGQYTTFRPDFTPDKNQPRPPSGGSKGSGGSNGNIGTGLILGNSNIGIGDALEIFKYLAGMPSVIEDDGKDSRAWNASLIKGGSSPGIADALEILKLLAGMESVLN